MNPCIEEGWYFDPISHVLLIGFSEINNASVEKIIQLGSLRTVGVIDCKVVANNITLLASLPNLQYVTLGGSIISFKEQVAEFCNSKSLAVLVLTGTNFNSVEVEGLRQRCSFRIEFIEGVHEEILSIIES